MSQDPRRRVHPDASEDDVLPTEHDTAFSPESDLLREMRRTITRLEHDHAARGDLKILNRALKELRYAFKVFKPYRRRRKVTVFGSARTESDHPAYIQAVEFARQIAAQSWMVVTGAGGGIMEAANVGAGREMSFGVNIVLPFEQGANHVVLDDPKLVNLRYFFTRKLLFVKEVHAIALFPGGFGTQDELFETLTLIQTGKRDLMPVVCVDEPGGEYWKSWFDWVKNHLDASALISPEDVSLLRITDDVDEAVDEILRFYSVYHSMRYVHDRLIIRLHVEPSDEFVEHLNAEFADLLAGGRIEKCGPHPHELEDAHLTHLPRLRLRFNRRSFGRLRELTDYLNNNLTLPENATSAPVE